MSTPVKLLFKSYEITKVLFGKPDGLLEGTFDVKLKHDNTIGEVDESGHREVSAELLLILTDELSDFNLQVQIFGKFEILDNIEELTYKNYLEISIPSILYPYLRAFITNLIVQTGMKPFLLPPINFGYKPDKDQVVDELEETE